VISVENHKFFPTRVLSAPDAFFLLGIGLHMISSNKYSDGATRLSKKFEDIFSRWDKTHERYGRTDRRRTDGRTPADSKDHAYAYRRAVKTINVFR